MSYSLSNPNLPKVHSIFLDISTQGKIFGLLDFCGCHRTVWYACYTFIFPICSQVL